MRCARGVAVGVGIVLLLTACGPAEPEPSTSPSPASTPTPSTSPSPTAPSQDPADPSTWIISPEGIGPVQLGQTRAEALSAATAYVEVDRGACANPAVTFAGSPGATTADAEMLIVTGESGIVVGVTINVPGPATATGIQVGATAAAVRAAYPEGMSTQRITPDDQWTVDGEPGWITFGSSDGEPGSPVGLISVIEGGTPPHEFCG